MKHKETICCISENWFYIEGSIKTIKKEILKVSINLCIDSSILLVEHGQPFLFSIRQENKMRKLETKKTPLENEVFDCRLYAYITNEVLEKI